MYMLACGVLFLMPAVVSRKLMPVEEQSWDGREAAH